MTAAQTEKLWQLTMTADELILLNDLVLVGMNKITCIVDSGNMVSKLIEPILVAVAIQSISEHGSAGKDILNRLTQLAAAAHE